MRWGLERGKGERERKRGGAAAGAKDRRPGAAACLLKVCIYRHVHM